MKPAALFQNSADKKVFPSGLPAELCFYFVVGGSHSLLNLALTQQEKE